MTLEELRAVARSLVSQGVKKVNLIGGEPLLQEYLFDIIKEFSSKFDISITTNGTLLTRKCIERLRNRIERLTISLDTVNSRIGHDMRGSHYMVSSTMHAIEKACSMNIPLKVNTVVTKYNLHNLIDIGYFLYKFNAAIFWKLFEVTWNQNVSGDINSFKPAKSKIKEQFTCLKRCFPELPMDIAYREELQSNYIIIRSNGDIHIPKYLRYKCLGNVLRNDLFDLLKNKQFSFDKNRQIYQMRNPIVQHGRLGYAI